MKRVILKEDWEELYKEQENHRRTARNSPATSTLYKEDRSNLDNMETIEYIKTDSDGDIAVKLDNKDSVVEGQIFIYGICVERIENVSSS